MSLSEEWGLTQADLIHYQMDDINSSVLEILMYALYTAVYVHTIRAIVTSKDGFNMKSRTPLIHCAILTVMWIFTTIRTGMTWYFIDNVYITHGNTRQDMFDANINPPQSTVRLSIFWGLALAVNVIIAECVMIWRCWIIYGRVWWVVVLPLLCLAVEMVSFILFQRQFYADVGTSVTSSEANWRIVYIALTVTTNLLSTGLIILRIGVSRFRTYHGVVEILVESSLLYSITHLVYLGVYVHAFNDPSLNISDVFPQALLPAVTGIAPALIISRAASGKSQPNQTWQRSGMSLRFPTTNVQRTTVTQLSTFELSSSPFDVEGDPRLERKTTLDSR